MNARRCLLGLTFCTCYLASHLTNKYVLSVLKFTYPTLFQGWQTFIGGLLLHVSWKLGWVEINSSPRSNVLTWLPASLLFVGIIYAGSRALSRLAVPVFFILHNVAEVLICGYQKYVWKEKTSFTKICSDIDQQYLNYIFSMVLLAFASHPTGDLFSVLDFPFLYFYRFHGSCWASGVLGFLLMLSTVKLRSALAPGQCAAWIFFAKGLTMQSWLRWNSLHSLGWPGDLTELYPPLSMPSLSHHSRPVAGAV
ncbi:transmembrane protein 241 isoform X6 [Meriones unguiculatus]|uniref:transmembrane protein 241 isoform X6 n=1 Tax=Meriones unguiculatus TaxID=10047 RepID=UPI00293F066F|nr:transmembrane protein 241 isoform X6 [Meriones unguiculatus]